MKLYLSADIEGTCGIVNWDETKLECEFSQHYRTQMSKEITAACDGATQSGVHEILVKDAHDSGRNINPNILPENVKILRGWTKDPLVMMAGIDESFDACIFTGYHSGATCNGNPLSHTMDIDYDYFKINDEIASEFTINAYIAAYYNVNGSISIHPNLALKKIEKGVKKALSGDLSRHLIKLPDKFKIEIKFREHYKAFKASFYPNMKKIDSQTVLFETEDYYEFLRMLLFI
ncbi:M55 family metallopeptidase [Clostridioides sp. ES-S-0077-01]|uniref:M55 family metallopeptidase n=1 Tax=Clostridioides sp. ES-S-0077-01 TaxID=2770782 RepID=UPI001D10A501|nr:M55 family metallopeptidase [Clostridioides sp. ES-S-0077-01]